MVTILNVMGF